MLVDAINLNIGERIKLNLIGINNCNDIRISMVGEDDVKLSCGKWDYQITLEDFAEFVSLMIDFRSSLSELC